MQAMLPAMCFRQRSLFCKKRKKCHFALYSLRFSLTLQAESACKSFYTEIQETEISKNSYI